MIEKISRVSNPLTIIAIFAALSEIAATTALAFVAKELQPIFIWFVMLFPVILVSMFFYTLNRKPKVFYAPSDFRDDQSYIAVNQSLSAIEKISTKSQSTKIAHTPGVNDTKNIIQQIDIRILQYLFNATNKKLSIYQHSSLYSKAFGMNAENGKSNTDLLSQGAVVGIVISFNSIILSIDEYKEQTFQFSIFPDLLKLIEVRLKKENV